MFPTDDAKWEGKPPFRREDLCLLSPQRHKPAAGEGRQRRKGSGPPGATVGPSRSTPRMRSRLCAAGSERSLEARRRDSTAGRRSGAEELLGGSCGSSSCVGGRFGGGRARFDGRAGLWLRHDEGSSRGYGRGYASPEIHGGRTKKRGGGALVAPPCCCPSTRVTPAGSSQSGAAYLGARRLSEE
jgi:hypothetical protein